MMVTKTCVVSHLVKCQSQDYQWWWMLYKKKIALLPWTDQGREGLKWLLEEGG